MKIQPHNRAKPFLKWAGGKGQLLKQLDYYYPIELREGKIKKYIEPFVGGGAVFFDVMQKFKIKNAYISDVNKDLILTYKVIQRKKEQLLDFLEQYQNEYDSTKELNRNNLFLSVREHFNQQRFEINYKKIADNWIPRAAQLIFLNKTCFNGLFRLNSKGGFNVPFGKYENPTIIDADNILKVSKILDATEIIHADYATCYNKVDDMTFVYFDPPYRPISQTSSFTTYAGNEFTDSEQIKLAKFYRKLDVKKKSKLMLSNSDPKNINLEDDFFEHIFKDYHLNNVYARRAINCNGSKRGKINELLITNYTHEPRASINYKIVKNLRLNNQRMGKYLSMW